MIGVLELGSVGVMVGDRTKRFNPFNLSPRLIRLRHWTLDGSVLWRTLAELLPAPFNRFALFKLFERLERLELFEPKKPTPLHYSGTGWLG
jgi:hypothetical protein